MSENRAWDRMENEPEKPWTIFSMFLNTPRPRPSLRKWSTAQSYNYDTLKLWSRKYAWKNRIIAHDAWKYEVMLQETTPKTDSLQQKLVEEEVEDYERLRDVWAKALQRVETMLAGDDLAEAIQNINNLALARKRLDELGRRAVKLPTTYSSRNDKGTDDLPEADEALYLDFQQGPMRVPDRGLGDDDASFVPGSAYVAEDGEGQSGEI